EQERADAITLRRIRIKFLWISTDGLHVREPAILADAIHQSAPASMDGGLKSGAVKQSLVDAPRKSVGVEAGTAGFRERVAIGIEQAGPPQTVCLLQGQEAVGHFAILLYEPRAGRVVGRQNLKNAHQSGDDPAVAAAPEHLGPVRFVFREIGAVAEEEMIGFVVEV